MAAVIAAAMKNLLHIEHCIIKNCEYCACKEKRCHHANAAGADHALIFSPRLPRSLVAFGFAAVVAAAGAAGLG